MSDQKKMAPSDETRLKNICPDLRRSLVAAGVAPEQKYAWMVLNKISPKPYGENNLLLVAPHGFPGDDDNTEILTCYLAEELKCYAVVNNRKYNRYGDPDKHDFCEDLNDKDLAPNCPDFWTPLMEFTELILRTYVKPPLILFIHGIGDDNADEYLGKDVDFALGAGYEGKYNPDTATASEGLVVKLRDAITKKFRSALDGVPGYGATGRVPVLFKQKFPNHKIEAIQLEIRCRGYRDSVDSIRKLVKGLTEILTDTGKDGFQEYVTRERKALSAAGSEYVSQRKSDVTQKIVIDEEFKSLIPELSKDEYLQLEENIVRDGGCRDPLSVWPHEGNLILLDGHHRREICRKRGLPHPAIVEVQLESREEAIQWIAENQTGRRSLTPFQRIELAYRMEPSFRELTKARQKKAYKLRGKGPETKDEASLHSDEILGKIAGVGARTYRKARDILKHGSEDLIQKWRDGEISVDAASKQIEKPREQRTVKKLVETPVSPSESAPGVGPKPSSIVADQAVPQTELPVSVPGLPLIKESQEEKSKKKTQLSSGAAEGGAQDEVQSGQKLPPPCGVIVINKAWGSSSIGISRLAELPLAKMAATDCILWLWTPVKHIRDVFRVLDKWGFEFRTILAWLKPEAVKDEWLYDMADFCLVATKGEPGINADYKLGTFLKAMAEKGAQEPQQFFNMVEKRCVDQMRLEIFAESPRKGWLAWPPVKVKEEPAKPTPKKDPSKVITEKKMRRGDNKKD